MADSRESLAWDRVGRFLQDSGSTASGIARRHIDYWSSVSDHLRKGDRYRADDMAGDVASSAVTAMDDLNDIWSLLTRSRTDNRFAQNLPTIFLLFEATGPRTHALPNPVRIEIDTRFRSAGLPRLAEIDLSRRFSLSTNVEPTTEPALTEKLALVTEQSLRGKPESTTQLQDYNVWAAVIGVTRLQECLFARRRKKSRCYVLEGMNPRLSTSKPKPPDERASADKSKSQDGTGPTGQPAKGGPASDGKKTSPRIEYSGLIPGTYDGLVYLTDPAIALADLRIIVEPGTDPQTSSAPEQPGVNLQDQQQLQATKVEVANGTVTE